MGYSSAMKSERNLNRDVFLLQLCLSLQGWFCPSFWFYQHSLTCSDSLPLMLLQYLLGLPAAHVLASSSLLNYLKLNFCILSKRRDRTTAAQKLLLFRGAKARDTLRTEVHIPLQTCASPSWLTHHPGEGTPGHCPSQSPPAKTEKVSLQHSLHCELWGLHWQQKINPASHTFQHSKLFSLPWPPRFR